MVDKVKNGAKKMAETGKVNVASICAIVGCIATLMTCGLLIGNLQGDLRNVAKTVDEIKQCQSTVTTDVSDLKSKHSYLEGVVSTQLGAILTRVSRIDKQVDDLIKAD